MTKTDVVEYCKYLLGRSISKREIKIVDKWFLDGWRFEKDEEDFKMDMIRPKASKMSYLCYLVLNTKKGCLYRGKECDLSFMIR